MHGHAKADARNLHLHRVAFEKLLREPERTRDVRAVLERWLREGMAEASRSWLEQWRQMLDEWPLERIAAVVLDPERGQSLRQCSPLAPVLTPQERWAALRELRDAS